ncbi:glycosyltransferase [Cohnella faecalis]|uniref:Glycosyltransferase subfamily 4-like N-terminal domain-containing protein n=1 Tax=Cohnella faecalis TaxID=2315694 RepID=A0A398CMC6_9BACL|nr:glycosyltransferase family 4 protein [Cohnella faecalis]RIE03803.1 hypothetical protein D3H35_09625 [Cohnella faecalis]
MPRQQAQEIVVVTRKGVRAECVSWMGWVVQLNILQVADHFGPFGGLEKFIYDFSRKLAGQGDTTAIAVIDKEERHDWGSETIDTALIPRDEEQWLAFAKRYRPDLIVWHTGPATASFVDRLSTLAPVIATVHSPVCPAGTRLFRDKDEICCHPTGAACLMRWYTRRCGTHPEPWLALEAMTRNGKMLKTLRSCDRVYTVSESLSRFIEIEGIKPDRLRIFDNTFGDGTGGARRCLPCKYRETRKSCTCSS